MRRPSSSTRSPRSPRPARSARNCGSRTTSRPRKAWSIVAEVLNNKSTYNTLELTSGRMAKVGKGDIVVGALGPRRALFGYSGHVPAALKPGDIIQMLNIGGVHGHLRLGHPRQGQAVRLPRAGRGAAVSRIWASASACRRASATGRSTSTRTLDTARRAGGGAGRHLHGSRQDRRRRRHRRPHAPPRPDRRCVQGHRRVAAARHPGVRGCRRAPHHDLHRSGRRHDHARAPARRSRAPC